MARPPPGTVKDTGAKTGSYLIGLAERPLNRGLKIKVHKDQGKREGGRILGGFDLVDAGRGT